MAVEQISIDARTRKTPFRRGEDEYLFAFLTVLGFSASQSRLCSVDEKKPAGMSLSESALFITSLVGKAKEPNTANIRQLKKKRFGQFFFFLSHNTGELYHKRYFHAIVLPR